jgi:aldehyde dehydrogenase (NAD+)
MSAYLKPAWMKSAGPLADRPAPVPDLGLKLVGGRIDRTAKLYVGGKQVRPDGGYSRGVAAPNGKLLGEVGEGNRKDIRDAVEAARLAQPKWAAATEHNRAQVLYYVAENLDARASEFADRLRALRGVRKAKTRLEVDAAVVRLFRFAAWADKHEGAVHKPPFRGVALAMNEPVGVVGVACPEEAGLLAFVSLMGAALATGNAVVMLPSERQALIATDFYQVLDTSDVPAGVVNIVTGDKRALAVELARHDAVDAVWAFGSVELVLGVERASAGNLKQTWTEIVARDWTDPEIGGGRDVLGRATQVKNVWIPYGE